MKKIFVKVVGVLFFVPYCLGQDTPITSAPHEAESIQTSDENSQNGITLERLNEVSDQHLGAALRAAILANLETDIGPTLKREFGELSGAPRNADAISNGEHNGIVEGHRSGDFDSEVLSDEEEPAISESDEDGYGLEYGSRGGATSLEFERDGSTPNPEISAETRDFVHDLGVGVTNSEAVGEGMLSAGTRGGGSTYTVISKGNEAVYAAVLYWTPESSRSGDLAVFTSAHWTATGWYKIPPGQSKNVYVGSRKKIYVRLTRGSIGGTAIVPTDHDKKISFGVHRSRFRVKAYGTSRKSYTLRYGESLQNYRTGSSLKEMGASIVDNFYYVNAHTNMTVR